MNDWAAFSNEENGNNENGQMSHSASAPNGYPELENGHAKHIADTRNAQSEESNNMLFNETFFDPLPTPTKPILNIQTNGNGVKTSYYLTCGC